MTGPSVKDGWQTALPARAERAQAFGLEPAAHPNRPGQLCNDCDASSYEYCDIDSLTVGLTHGSQNHRIALTTQRRNEPVEDTVAEYAGLLRRHDLVLEALAHFPPVTGTGKSHPDNTSRSPLFIAAEPTATFECSDRHPAIRIGSSVPQSRRTALEELWIHSPAHNTFNKWRRLWPFSTVNKTIRQVKAESCGIRPDGMPVRTLSVAVVTMPEARWELTLGITEGSGVGVVQNFLPGQSLHDRPINSQQTINRPGDIAETYSTRKTGHEDFATKTTFTSRKAGVLVTKDAIIERDSTTDVRKFESKKIHHAKQISLSRTIGGHRAELDISRNLNALIKAIDNLKKWFDDLRQFPKFGWIVNGDVSYLVGSLKLGWGCRWPASYTESHRVYGVEQFVSVGGKCTLASGRLEIGFGIEFDPALVPVEVVAKVSLSITADVFISGAGNLTHIAGRDVGSGSHIALTVGGQIAIELATECQLQAFGSGYYAKLSSRTVAGAEGRARLSFDEKPSLKISLGISETVVEGTIHSELLTNKTRSMPPIKIFDAVPIWRDKEFFGDE